MTLKEHLSLNRQMKEFLDEMAPKPPKPEGTIKKWLRKIWAKIRK